MRNCQAKLIARSALFACIPNHCFWTRDFEQGKIALVVPKWFRLPFNYQKAHLFETPPYSGLTGYSLRKLQFTGGFQEIAIGGLKRKFPMAQIAAPHPPMAPSSLARFQAMAAQVGVGMCPNGASNRWFSFSFLYEWPKTHTPRGLHGCPGFGLISERGSTS